MRRGFGVRGDIEPILPIFDNCHGKARILTFLGLPGPHEGSTRPNSHFSGEPDEDPDERHLVKVFME